MIKGLEHFYIEGEYGGNQDRFYDPTMKLGGCGAETAMDSSVYFSLYLGMDLYPFDLNNINRKDYRKFGSIMKPYLSPRMTGIDKLSIYVDGYGKYLKDLREERIEMEEFSGEEDFDAAWEVVKNQIDKGLPIPMLMLLHHDKKYSDYNWHWFIVNGYAEEPKAPAPGPGPTAGCAASNSIAPEGETGKYIRTVTYGEWDWLDFKEFWNSGDSRKGGLIIYKLKNQEEENV